MLRQAAEGYCSHIFSFCGGVKSGIKTRLKL